MIKTHDSIRTIRLCGILGATFGREFKLSVSSPKEDVRALCVILPGFERYLNTSKQRGLTYAVFSGKRNLISDELDMDKGCEDIWCACAPLTPPRFRQGGDTQKKKR